MSEVTLTGSEYGLADDINRSICIDCLRDLLQQLHHEDYTHFVDNILKKQCRRKDTACQDNRLVIIDIVSRIADPASQELVQKHVLSRVLPVNEELRRVFIHCAAMKHPTEVCVWRVCFTRRVYQSPRYKDNQKSDFFETLKAFKIQLSLSVWSVYRWILDYVMLSHICSIHGNYMNVHYISEKNTFAWMHFFHNKFAPNHFKSFVTFCIPTVMVVIAFCVAFWSDVRSSSRRILLRQEWRAPWNEVDDSHTDQSLSCTGQPGKEPTPERPSPPGWPTGRQSGNVAGTPQ